PGVGDELGEAARGHGLVDHDRGRRVAENIDSDEILERIVGGLCMIAGMSTCVLVLPNRKVCPSGCARATSVAPAPSPPPSRVSVTAVTRNGCIFPAHSRPTTSVAPPGENGTTSLMARSG